MASLLNEELMKTNLDIPEGEIKIEGKVNPVYADAINVHNKKKKETEKILKDKNDEVKEPILGTKGKTTIMPKTDGMKKLKLSEEMFKEDTTVLDRKSWELRDKRNNKDTWSDIYNELVDMKDLETPHRQLKKSPKQRYSGGWDEEGVRVAPSRTDDAIVVYADEESQLDHAKEVAETYGVEFTVREHTSRYAEARFELKIYPSRPVMSESLVESVDNDIYSAVAKYFDYGASSEFTEVIADLVDRALMNKDEDYDTEEAVHDAIDSGLIYHKDIWTVKAGYEDSTLNDETYESLFHDIYSIVDSMSSEDVDEGLTKAERHNRMLDRVFDYKKETDRKMMDFLKVNSELSDEEIQDAYNKDNLGGVLKDLGLHDKFWGKNESIKRTPKLVEGFYRGAKGVEFVGHGEWADPELIYNGYSFNYWDIEDALWHDFLEETGYSDAQSDDPKVEKQFNKFVQDRATDYLDDCIFGGVGTPIDEE